MKKLIFILTIDCGFKKLGVIDEEEVNDLFKKN